MTDNTVAASRSPVQQQDAGHHVHPFTNTRTLNEKGARVISRAEGVYVWDDAGNKILDAMAGLWCMSIGYGRTEVADAVHAQMLELPYYNTFFQTTHQPVAELSKKLAEISPPGINRTFFTSGGSDANDTMLRLVRHYWSLLGKPSKKVIIARENAYHGSTVAGASLGGMKFMHEQGDLPIPNIVHIGQPYWYKEGGDLTPEAFGLKRAQELEAKILELGEDKVAAFIAEPIQGAGGVIIPPDSYWPEIQRICDKYEILLVADEVITGFGRTGEMFASVTYNLKPDVICIAKALSSGYLPIGGVMISDRVADVLVSEGGEFAHGYTYSGHPAACAAALKVLEIMEREDLVNYVKNDIGPYLKERWLTLAEHPLVGEARMKGLVGALELTPDKVTRAPFDVESGTVGTICREFCFNNGLVMRAVGDTMIISPPLVLSHEEADELVEKAKAVLDLTYDAAKEAGYL
ncbi:MAG: aspartate aminotransferase family protein [Proteobacteria bacterium]|nr:MAG: aspartate aminotransferase family protein [Pseudomonadota bacterium]